MFLFIPISKIYIIFIRFTFKLQRPPEDQLLDTLDEQHAPPNHLKDGQSKNDGRDVADELDGSGDVAVSGEMEGFGYNSFVLEDDDSDPEEFVNIVVNEIASGISGDQAVLLANEVKTIKRASLIPASSIDLSDLDAVDRATSIQSSSITIPSVKINSSDQISSSGSFKEADQTSTREKRTFSFFKRNKESSSTSSLPRRRTSDTSLIIPKRDDKKFESSLNFEPNTTPVSKKKTIRIREPDQTFRNREIEGDITSLCKETIIFEAESVTTNSATKRKSSDMEWDNISQHNIEPFRMEPPPLDEEKEPTGQKTTNQSANKVKLGFLNY